MDKVVLGLGITVIFVAVIFLVLHTHKNNKKPMKEDGYLNIGFNKYSGKTVYQIEFLSDFDKIESSNYILLKVHHVNKNLGVNPILYDLESEGIDVGGSRK